MTLSGIGIWSFELRHYDAGEVADAAAELESLGCSAIWIPDIGGDVMDALERLLAPTSTMTIATGVLNIWMHDAADVVGRWTSWSDDWKARCLLGLGISHGAIVGDNYGAPIKNMNAYLDALDEAGLPADRRCLAALRPKMLGLARERTAGAHPYLVTPEHTAEARAALGPGKLLAPEQGFIFEKDATKAREIGRAWLSGYAEMPNYAGNWIRMGFTEDDVKSLSDRLVDGLVAWGGVDAIADRVRAHWDAGADHVCVQVHQSRDAAVMPREGWRAVVEALAS
jgi:probable F420-dependent oxidoreductase